jgi:hypothetical protein
MTIPMRNCFILIYFIFKIHVSFRIAKRKNGTEIITKKKEKSKPDIYTSVEPGLNNIAASASALSGLVTGVATGTGNSEYTEDWEPNDRDDDTLPHGSSKNSNIGQ